MPMSISTNLLSGEGVPMRMLADGMSCLCVPMSMMIKLLSIFSHLMPFLVIQMSIIYALMRIYIHNQLNNHKNQRSKIANEQQVN